MTSPHTTALLRGGRLRKTSRGVLTFAPFLATASAVALGALLSLAPTDSAQAQTAGCTESMSVSGAFSCSGNATSTQTLAGGPSEQLTVSDPGAFSIDTNSGSAFVLTTDVASTGLHFDLDGNITANSGTTDDGIFITHNGTGDMDIITDGTITASDIGIRVQAAHATSTPGIMRINATGAISVGGYGIDAQHDGTGNLTISASSITTTGGASTRAIFASHDHATSSANVTVTVGSISAASASHGVLARTSQTGATGDIRINATGDVTAGARALSTYARGNNDMVISISGTVDATAATNPIAIEMSQAATMASARLIMNTGASIDSGDAVIARQTADMGNATDDADAVLELAAASDANPSSFPLADMSNFTGFTYFEKTGAGTWTLTGEQPSGKAFTSAILRAGTLHLSAATMQLGSTSLAMSADTTLSVSGTNTIMGGLNSNAGGNISLATGDAVDASDRLTVTGAVSAGGTVTLDADLTGTTPAVDSLVLEGTVTGSVTVSLRVAATENMTAAPVALITGTGASGVTLTKATSAPCTISGAMCDFTLSGTMATITVSGVTGGPPPPPPPPEPMDMIVADACTEQDATPGRFICAGTVMATQTLAAESGETLRVEVSGDDFTITAPTNANDDALTLTGMSGSTGLHAVIDGTIAGGTANGRGIYAHHSGSGDIYVSVSGTITSGRSGIQVSSYLAGGAMSASGDMTIISNADITVSGNSSQYGIFASHRGSGTLSITSNGTIMAEHNGIQVTVGAETAAATITTSGNITSTNQDGIYIQNNGDDPLSINITGGTITATSSAKDGIRANALGGGDINISIASGAVINASGGIDAEISDAGTGNIIVELGGSIDSMAATAVAIDMEDGSSHTLRLLPGFSLGDGDAVHSSRDDAILELAATAADDADTDTSAAFDLSDLANFHDGAGTPAKAFTNLSKTGDGSWTLTGTQTASRSFDSVSIAGGTLQLGDGTDPAVMALDANATFTLSGGALEFMGTGNMISGSETAGEEATLRLAGASGGSFNLADLSHFANFATFEKTDAGTWTLTGTQRMEDAFTSASVMAGALRLNAATFRPGSTTLTIADNASLEIMGANTIHGTLDNSAGAISLALGDTIDASDRLSVMGAFTGGGSLTLDVDLTGAQPASDRLSVTGAVSGSTTINLRIAGNEDLELTADTAITADDPRSALVLVEAPTATPQTAFTQSQDAEDHCTLIGSRGSCKFSLQQDATSGDWTLATLEVTLASVGDAQSAVVESYAASLADIAALSGLAARQANRHYATDNTERGFWAQIHAAQAETTPSFSSVATTRDTRHTRARFGLDMPLPLADVPLENFTLGGNFWLAQAETDISSSAITGKGDIETDAFGFAATATLEHSLNLGGAGGGGNAAEGGSAPRKNGSMYVDGQLQYAAFSSDLTASDNNIAETLHANHDATSWGAALELGYRLPPALHGISFTPQAQLTWSSIDFDAFTDASDERISIADGETLIARLGIAATAPLTAEGLSLFSPRPIQGAREARGWVGDGAGASTFLHASADILFPLDGETAANLGDSRLISDMQDPALSLTAGGVFPLNATTTLAADLATTQSDETETYRASLSARFSF